MLKLDSRKGAIDLSSTMVGIIVIGLVAGVIAATVFAVIPWAQDSSAKQQLAAISTAENAYAGLEAETYTGSKPVRYGNLEELDEEGLLSSETDDRMHAFYTGENGDAHYLAVTQSTSGKWFYMTDVQNYPTGVSWDDPGMTDEQKLNSVKSDAWEKLRLSGSNAWQ